MKTLKLAILCLSLLVSVSCKRKSTVISNSVNIKVLNQQGQNLLAAPATYSKNNIEIYYIVNGQAQLYNQPHLDADKGFLLIKDGNGVDKIRVFVNYKVNEPTALTLIKFGNSQADTIKCEFRFEEDGVFMERTWYNGVLQPPGDFTVVK